MDNIKFSFITVVYNGEKTIADCIQSVLTQDYNNIEYIIIDGNSIDDTKQIVQSFGDKISQFVSEPDNGIYDAMNKGVSLATGEVVGILNADDFYATTTVISEIAELFSIQKCDAVSSSIAIYKNNNFDKVWRLYDATKFKLWQFRLGIQPPHPGFFVKNDCYKKFGLYDINFKISGDFDMLFRLLYVHKIKTHYTRFISVKMRDGGVSSKDIKSKVLMNKEDLRSLKKNGTYSNLFLIWLKYPIKVLQLLRK